MTVPGPGTPEGRVDAVIVTFNNAGDLPACVAAARAWDRVARVIVVDNDSSDLSAEVADRIADVVVRIPVNIGFGAAQNRGRSESASPYLLVLNPDARVDPAGLEAGFRVLAASADVALVEGEIRRDADGAEERWQGRPPGLLDLVARLLQLQRWLGEDRLKRLAARGGARYFLERSVDAAREVDFLAAVAVLARREALESVGGFDEAFFLYAEDIDFCIRLRDGGWRLVAIPSPWATHIGGASSKGRRLVRRRLWWESHRLLVERHWSGPRRHTGLALSWAGLTTTRVAERTQAWISSRA